MQGFKTGQAEIFYAERGTGGGPTLIWAHGWGQDHRAFQPFIDSLENAGRHIAVDFPGFGRSPVPPADWGTAEYADGMAKLIRNVTDRKVVWIGHSFGCRIGLQIAARHPDLIAGMFLIAAAGLKRRRPLWKSLYFKTRIAVYKALKKLIPLGLNEAWLMKTFASPDYQKAGPLRSVFVRVVNEDLSDIAQKVACPVILVYGENDTETPPETGERLARLIPGAGLVRIPGQDHYSVLGSGRHPVVHKLKTFIDGIAA